MIREQADARVDSRAGRRTRARGGPVPRGPTTSRGRSCGHPLVAAIRCAQVQTKSRRCGQGGDSRLQPRRRVTCGWDRLWSSATTGWCIESATITENPDRPRSRCTGLGNFSDKQPQL